VLTFTTYLLAGHAREQVCTYMCPWPRIQGAMLDQHSLLVTYRTWRGEARGAHKKGESWEDRGDCVDCNSCVAVCPMGIDIRDGEQLECINCALCIDACDDIMDKVGRPRGLIAYDTVAGLETQTAGAASRPKFFRPRTILYAGLITLVGVIMLVALLSRSDTDITVLRDRNPLFVQLSDGGIRNGYTVKILNKQREPRVYELSAEGLAGAELSIVGQGDRDVTVDADRLRSVRVHITAAGTRVPVSDFHLIAKEIKTGAVFQHATTFRRAR
jgi:cytochrome c oxidase accessory protein FixG